MMKLGAKLLVVSAFVTILSPWAYSQSCNFVTSATTMTLTNDCTTTSTITIPDGVVFNGNSHMVTATNPPAGCFSGPVVTNAPGATQVWVKNVILDAPNLGFSACQPPVSGILFDSVSGSIIGTTVLHMFNWDGTSVYLLSYGIHITNTTTGAPINVTVSGSKIFAGVYAAFLAEGSGVTVNVSGNQFRSSGPPPFSNFQAVWLNGAGGSVTGNIVEGAPAGGGAGIFIQNTPVGTKIASNNINLINGQVNDGILIGSDNAVITGNRVFNYATSGSLTTGIYNGGFSNPASNKITRNEVRCYATPFKNVNASSNVVLPCPWP